MTQPAFVRRRRNESFSRDGCASFEGEHELRELAEWDATMGFNHGFTRMDADWEIQPGGLGCFANASEAMERSDPSPILRTLSPGGGEGNLVVEPRGVEPLSAGPRGTHRSAN